MRLLEQIGSYAGLAAIPGLAVLSALYFSQARDVRRLREWAGRAPERAAEQAVGGRVAAVQPVAAPPQAGSPATPAVADAATPEAATPAPAVGDEGAAAQPATATTSAKPATAAAAASATGNGSSSTSVRPGPPAIGGGTAPRRTIPRVPSSQTSVLTPQAQPREPWYRRLAGSLPAARYVALIVAGVLVLGGGAVFGISQLADDGPASSNGASGSPASRGSGGDPADRDSSDKDAEAAISPSDVTVTVVNGTSVANLARDTATELSQQGFQIGNTVTGTGSLAAAESVVQYRPGANAEARLVADKLNISQKEPADSDAITQAGDASVIVVLGADQAPGG